MRLLYYYHLILCILPTICNELHHAISKRYVLFQRYTVLQFNYGLSVPLILPSRSINLSLLFQTNYDMPWNLSNFNPMYGRADNGMNVIDLSRHDFYLYAIEVLDGLNQNGVECLLRTICEIAAIPMDVGGDDNEHLMEKIVHFLLTPSLEYKQTSTLADTLEHKVLVAEHLGKSLGNCRQIFNNCDLSLVDMFTNTFLT